MKSRKFEIFYDVLVILVCVMNIYSSIRLVQVKNDYNELYSNCKTIIKTYCIEKNGTLICKYPEEFTVTQETDENGNIEIHIKEN